MIATGVLRGPHGLQGNIKLKTYSGEWEHLKSLSEVELRHDGVSQIMSIERFIDHGNELLIKFPGVHTPEEARRFNGWEIWIPRERASVLHSGEFYVADLIGCDLLFEGVVEGRVVSSFEGAQALLLEVRKNDGKRILIPFMREYIGAVDIEKKTIELLMKELLMDEGTT